MWERLKAEHFLAPQVLAHRIMERRAAAQGSLREVSLKAQEVVACNSAAEVSASLLSEPTRAEFAAAVGSATLTGARSGPYAYVGGLFQLIAVGRPELVVTPRV